VPDETPLQTVVCIEDNLDNLRLVEWVLEATGRYRVLGATDGVAGLELVRQRHPQLVLLDLDLPLVDGFELARRIRSEFRDIPVVAISASVMRDERQRSIGAGCMAFVEKPFDIVVFREVVADCIQRVRPQTGPQRPVDGSSVR
jgi:two-component system, cell cycle response regulator DivK